MKTLIAIVLFCCVGLQAHDLVLGPAAEVEKVLSPSLPLASTAGSTDPVGWFTSGGRFMYPLWVEYPFSYRLDRISTNWVTNSVFGPSCCSCPWCKPPEFKYAHPEYSLRIITVGKNGVNGTNDVVLARGESIRVGFDFCTGVILIGTNSLWSREMVLTNETRPLMITP